MIFCLFDCLMVDSFFLVTDIERIAKLTNIEYKIIELKHRLRSWRVGIQFWKLIEKVKLQKADLLYVNFLGFPYLFPLIWLSGIPQQTIIYACHDFKDHFGIITTIFGRGIIMLIFSLIFLVDKHILHKLSAIFLFIGGLCLLCLSFIAPQEDKYYQQENNISQENEKNNSSEDVPETKIDDSTPRNDSIDSNP